MIKIIILIIIIIIIIHDNKSYDNYQYLQMFWQTCVLSFYQTKLGEIDRLKCKHTAAAREKTGTSRP